MNCPFQSNQCFIFTQTPYNKSLNVCLELLYLRAQWGGNWPSVPLSENYWTRFIDMMKMHWNCSPQKEYWKKRKCSELLEKNKTSLRCCKCDICVCKVHSGLCVTCHSCMNSHAHSHIQYTQLHAKSVLGYSFFYFTLSLCSTVLVPMCVFLSSF